ncbi:hypothetical protein KO495_07600 [Colwellia sp. D2M02]|uniref:hypothetical protein n=1 Tax=Colwellia sp. D2M02 TaxID=2841562 RepID=UPI001C0A00A0|nr:hypothetical protein [Colwellia sp. D2M02]MBU2893191.1 hypothetical protein [Colwellia sp. D2M02]
MVNNISRILLSASLFALSTTVNASLITNGSFEQLAFNDNTQVVGAANNTNLASYQSMGSAWDVFYTLPGWVTTAGSGIELQKNVVTQSQDGATHVELDSDMKSAANTVMSQSLASLTVGADYLLEFFYKPRTNAINDNGVQVFWYDSGTSFDQNMAAKFIVNGTKNITPSWVKQSVVLTAQAETMDISFGAFGMKNSFGGLIDNVSLVQVSNAKVSDIPEPSIFALSLLGFGLLVRRHTKLTKNKVLAGK